MIAPFLGHYVYNSYKCTMVCPHVREVNPRAVASGLSHVQVENHVKTSNTTISVDLAHYIVDHAKIEKGRINRGNPIHPLVSSVDCPCVFISFIFEIYFTKNSTTTIFTYNLHTQPER